MLVVRLESSGRLKVSQISENKLILTGANSRGTVLKAEMETCMRLLGAPDVKSLGLQHINTRMVERDIYDGDSNLENGLWAPKAKL